MSIPYGRQQILQADIEAVAAVLQSDFLTQGPAVPRFEAAVAEHVGARHALAVNSATSALHLACLALELGPGDLLWTSPITFVASANCALYCGAQVDFVDIDPGTYNLCARALEAKLVQAEREGRLPKIVVPVHMCGQSCDMEQISLLARRYGFRIIEDASHAIGGRFKDVFIGAGQYSDITVFSFHPVKIITAGEGGMALTNSAELATRMNLLRSHGVTREPALMDQASHGAWYYQQIDLGFNYRMTDIQAALGHSQLQRLDDYVSIRHRLARQYDRLLADLPLALPVRRDDSYSAFHLYVVRVPAERRAAVFAYMREQGIGVNVHYIPVHTQPFYAAQGFVPEAFPQALAYYAEALSLPLYATLTDEQQIRVAEVLRQALQP
ncbi:MAG: UDP-4-amino-4,6-dideoxy-N-acetyl-beta-L-altrosamine transaminase [Pseudomonas citronellolis]|nr:MAG: UDP-4-amino-4,6-dideoxy-N-acetyl-beta-L-altrosamine transaminase [Pseudomonas citronellolis]